MRFQNYRCYINPEASSDPQPVKSKILFLVLCGVLIVFTGITMLLKGSVVF